MYSIDGWSELFLASAGAASALAGLVIVAISVNIKQILKYKWLPSRAAMTVALLTLVLLVSIAGLIKAQSNYWFGAEILLLSLPVWLLSIKAVREKIIHVKEAKRPKNEIIFSIFSSQIGILPFIAGGILLLTPIATTGLYVIAAAILTAFIAGMLNAWILLVEILR